MELVLFHGVHFCFYIIKILLFFILSLNNRDVSHIWGNVYIVFFLWFSLLYFTFLQFFYRTFVHSCQFTRIAFFFPLSVCVPFSCVDWVSLLKGHWNKTLVIKFVVFTVTLTHTSDDHLSRRFNTHISLLHDSIISLRALRH